MKIFKDSTTFGLPVWICFHSCYMYTGLTFLGLVKQMATEWNHDRHMIG